MAKKTKTVTAGNGSANDTIDIPHEEVKQFPQELMDRVETQTAEVQTRHQIAQELKKFNLAESGIEELKAKYSNLVISGPDDKEGYKKVREAWGFVRSKRTGLEKKGLEIRNSYGVITKAVKKEEERLIELLSPLEDTLYREWKRIDEEKEMAQREREEAEQRELMNRIEQLQKFGLVLDGGFYTLGEAISLDVVTLRSMPEEQFSKLLKKAEVIFQTEQDVKRLADEKRQQEAAELQRQKEEFERQQRELKQAQEKLEAERRAMDQLKAERAVAIKARKIQKLVDLGMVRVGNPWGDRGLLRYSNGFGGFDYEVIDILNVPDEDFAAFIDQTVELIRERDKAKIEHEKQQEEERKVLEAREKFIADQMEAAGLRYNYGKKVFEYNADDLQITADWNTFAGLDESKIIELGQGYKNLIEQNKEDFAKAEKDRAAELERERLAGLDDKERAQVCLNYLRGAAGRVEEAKFKSKKMKDWQENLLNNLLDTLKHFEV